MQKKKKNMASSWKGLFRSTQNLKHSTIKPKLKKPLHWHTNTEKTKKCPQPAKLRKKASRNPLNQIQISTTQTLWYKQTRKKLLISSGGGGAYILGKVRVFKDGSPRKDCDWRLVIRNASLSVSSKQKMYKERKGWQN